MKELWQGKLTFYMNWIEMETARRKTYAEYID